MNNYINNIKNKLKKHKIFLFSIISGLITINTIFILQKVSPFGNNSLLKIDFYHQYGPMLAELYNRLRTGKNLIYSFNVGLGIPYYRNYFNYLSSPINLLIILFKHSHLLTSYSLIIGLKSIMSCITCSYFIKKKFNTNSIYMIGISVLYAYSAYFTAYYWNVMWIDGLYILPLVTLGIENIVNKNNGVLYTLSLIYMLYTNYFIGYMICIYSCIYFLAYLLIKVNVKNIKIILSIALKFTICSLISGLILAFELIPMYEALKSTNATMGSFPTSQYYYFSIIEFFKNHLTGVNSTVLASDISNAPNISCGILSIALTFLFILNNNINIKRKIIYFLLLIFLLLSFYIAPLDYIWHAFHVPNDLPYRYSFIYSFILIIISSYTLNSINKLSLNKIIITYLFSLIFISFVYITKYENISSNMITVNYLLITVYFLIYLLYHFYPKLKNILSFLFVGMCIFESIITINHNWNISQNINNFYSDYSNITNSLNKIEDNDLFYRIEKNYILTFNDPAWYNYYGQETFSSMAYYDIAKLNHNLGMPGNEINSYYYKQNTPIYDLLFNIKYIVGNNIDNKRYELYYNDELNIYKFKYTTGLMFKVEDSIRSFENNYTNPIEYQNSLMVYLTNVENVFYRIKPINKTIKYEDNDETIIQYSYKNTFDNIYTYLNNPNINYIVINDTIYYNGTLDLNDINIKLNLNIENYNSYKEPYIINNYSNQDIINIYVNYKKGYYEEINTYSIDNEKFISIYNYLKLNEIKITDFKENIIKGTINLDSYSTIYTSIPYDSGWKVYCNNKRIPTFKINNSLLGYNLPKGNNNVILKYTPNNIDVGLSISITILIFTTAYLIIKNKRTNHQD